jgi:hypothetical protein
MEFTGCCMRTLQMVGPMSLLSVIGGRDVTSTSFSKNITIKVKKNIILCLYLTHFVN